jgi:UDP:flavonoid glycosyltransferase YjiC (YdhE family)
LRRKARINGETQEARLVGNQRTNIMKILIASTPATGHINPLLAITRVLRAEGHEITFLTGSAFRDRIENSGAKFVSLQGHADFDGRDFSSVAPELKDIPPGLEWFRVAIERIFVDAACACVTSAQVEAFTRPPLFPSHPTHRASPRTRGTT